jgi:hypothetical protein
VTNQNSFGRVRAQPLLPKGDVLGTYESYLEAQKVVDRLSKADLDVKQLTIVGNDLKTVEHVTGKLSYGRAALGGAASGAWFGLFIGLVLFIFSPVPNFALVAAAALIGAGSGMLFGIATYALGRRRRDFTSTHQVLASNYQVIVDPSLTAKAQEVLARPEPLNS